MLSERLRKARKAKKLTQEQLAQLVKTKKTTISNYETGYSTPSNEMLKDLADSLEVSTDWLLGRTDDPSPSNKNDAPSERKDELANVFFREWDKADEEKRKRTLEFLKFLNQMADEENSKI